MIPGPRDDDPLAVAAMLGAMVALGRAIQLNNGAYSEEAFKYAMVGLALALLPVVLVVRSPWLGRIVQRMLPSAFVLAVAYQFGVLASSSPIIYFYPTIGATPVDFQLLLGMAGVGCGMAVVTVRRPEWAASVVLVAFALLGLWTLRASPSPHIDVFTIHQESLAAFVKGINPYGITFSNPYQNPQWFAPGTATVERLNFGYVYPAWTLLAATPGYLLATDYRYSFLAAVVLSGALATGIPRSRWALGATVLFLFTPRTFFVLEQGWTEPTVLVGAAIAVYAASRRIFWLLAVGVGIVAVAKQYSILAAPAVFLLRPVFPTWRAFGAMLLKAAAVALVVTLPLVLWGSRVYWHNVYAMQFTAPIRPDALSIPTYWFTWHGSEMPKWLHKGVPLLLATLVVLRAPRTPSGFAWCGSVLYLIFFLFRQGFCNYYYLVIGLLALAIAAARSDSADGSTPAGGSWR
jgi:hypothetical protein